MVVSFLRIIAVVLIPVALLLALMSRKNFSKYKSDGILGGIVRKIRQLLAGGGLYSEAELERITDEYAYKLFRMAGISVAAVNILFLILSLYLSQGQSDNVVERPLTGDPPIEVHIDTGDQGEKSLLLEVYPREYSSEEFEALADKAVDYAVSVIPGNNPDLMNVSSDLKLITSDETGTLSFTWSSLQPDVVGSSGRIYEISEEKEVILELTITDGIHERMAEIPIRVVPEKMSEDEEAKLMSSLEEYEKADRTEGSITFPKEINGQRLRVSRESSGKKQVLIYAVLGIGAIAYICHGLSELKERKGKRQEALRRQYYSFVSRLSLLIGAGINVKEAMRLASEGAEELAGEVRLAVNQIDSGLSEEKAYLAMSGRMGIPEYTRLMTMISQNINHGNSKLLLLMDQEVKNAMNIRREHIRKKGETASEKLLIPTALLLVIVIGVIMIPALKTAM